MSRQLLGFILVGTVGFVIDAGILTILANYFALNLYLGRAVSFSVASLVTWMLNRLLTFRAATRHTPVNRAEYFRYLLVQVGGALINLLVFTALLYFYPMLKSQPVIPLAIGAIFGLAYNFTGARLWVYAHGERGIG